MGLTRLCGRTNLSCMQSRLLTAAVGALACLAVACGDRSAAPVDPLPGPGDMRVTGRAFLHDGSAPAGLRVILDGDIRVSAPLAADGTFSVEGRVSGDSVDVIIDIASDAPRTTLPALVRVSARTPATLRVVLVPAHWTITGGSYGGEPVAISADAAFRPPCTNPSNINCDGYYPRAWFGGVKIWPHASLPVPLAFDHGGSHRPVSAADSAAFWEIAESVNATTGLPLFRAARAIDVAVAPNGTPSGGIAVRVDTTLATYAAFTNWWWNANGELVAGVIRVRALHHLRSAGLMSHELLHTHGYKHSCAWATVMDGYGCNMQRTAPSAPDVAYLQLARRVHETQRANSAPHGLVAALQGERVVLRGLPPYAPGTAVWQVNAFGDGTTHGDHAH
jgi:hypothetical protein